MAEDEKTKSYNLRLVKGFGNSTGATVHRRAGVVLSTGPKPETVELTKDQVEAIKADAAFEFVSDKEAAKFAPAEEESTPEETAAEKAAREAADNAAADKAKAEAAAAKKAKEAEKAAGKTTTPPLAGNGTPPDATNGRVYEGGEGDEATKLTIDPNAKLVDLQAQATSVGVVDADKLRSKQAVIEAIEAATKPSGE